MISVEFIYFPFDSPPQDPVQWSRLRSVVCGRVVNGYLGSDWALAFSYRKVVTENEVGCFYSRWSVSALLFLPPSVKSTIMLDAHFGLPEFLSHQFRANNPNHVQVSCQFTLTVRHTMVIVVVSEITKKFPILLPRYICWEYWLVFGHFVTYGLPQQIPGGISSACRSGNNTPHESRSQCRFWHSFARKSSPLSTRWVFLELSPCNSLSSHASYPSLFFTN